MLLHFAGQQKTRNALIQAGFMDFFGLLETNKWCPEPESNRHADFSARDFKSLVSTYSTIRAVVNVEWRRGSESNRRTRLCRPLHDHSATPPWLQDKLKDNSLYARQKLKRENEVFSFAFPAIWSGKGVSNSRPQPWQGCALPTELFPRNQDPTFYPIRRDCQSRHGLPASIKSLRHVVNHRHHR